MPHPKAFKAAMAAAIENERRSRDKIVKAFERYPPGHLARRIERVALASDPGDNVVMSSYAVRRVVRTGWIRAFLDLFSRIQHDEGVRFYLFTFTPSEGFTFEDDPVLDVDKVKRKARHLLKKLGMNAICALDIDILAKPLEGEQARRLILHIHGLCWTRDPNFKPAKTGKKLSARPEYANPLGVPAVSFQSRAMARSRIPRDAPRAAALYRHPERDQTARSIADLALYLTKAPVATKNRYTDSDGQPHVRHDEHHFTLRTALRLNELYSHFTPEQMMFSFGNEGNRVRTNIRDSIRRRFPSVGYKKRRASASKVLLKAWTRFLEVSLPELRPSDVHHRMM